MSDPHVEGKPEQLGRYELLTRVAGGGMAEVFVARVRGEGGFERLVAVKRMLKTIAEDEHFAEMFLDEGRIAGLIESPNVVQIFDVGRADSGELFIAMELVRGVALHRLLSLLGKGRQAIPVPIAVAILVQAAEGLGAAHRATTPMGEPLGIVHRDVSPQNILVGIDGRVRVADFGVARAVHRRTSTSTGELKGKLAYFAPEQLRSQPATQQSDVFALGIVAWETLAMRRLFQGDNPVDTIERIRTVVPTPLDALRADVPSALARAIERALAKDAADRTDSAVTFARELAASVEPADAATLSAFLREWVDAEVRGLEERIRAALTGRIENTSQDIALPSFVEDRSGVRPSDHLDSTLAKMGMPPPAPLEPIAVVVPALAPPPVITHERPRRSAPQAAAMAPATPSRMPLYLLSGVILALLVGALVTLALGPLEAREAPAPRVPSSVEPAPVAAETPAPPPVAPVVLDEPIADEPVANDPAAPVADDPVAHDPVAHDPAAHDPAAHDPAAHDPAARDTSANDLPPSRPEAVTEEATSARRRERTEPSEPAPETAPPPAPEPETVTAEPARDEAPPRRRGGLLGRDSFLRDVEEE